MKIVTYNVHYAIGKDNRYDLQRLIDSVKGADIVALQEVERNYGPPDGPSQPKISLHCCPTTTGFLMRPSISMVVRSDRVVGFSIDVLSMDRCCSVAGRS